MTQGSWLALLDRQGGDRAPIGFDEIVVGHDFGLLGCRDIQAWVRDQAFQGPLCAELVALEGDRTLRFEEVLWAACGEATGKVPRPGGKRWAQAQDRWRVALLRDIMAAPLTAEALAVAVESIYERVGCPEDMLGLWKRPSPWERKPGVADRKAIDAFLLQKDGEGAKV